MWRVVSAAGLACLLYLGGKIDPTALGFHFPKFTIIQSVAIAGGLYVSLFFLSGGHKILWLAYKTLPRDLR